MVETMQRSESLSLWLFGRHGYLDQYSRTKKHPVLTLLLTATLFSFCPTGVRGSLEQGRVAIVPLRPRSRGIIVDLWPLVLNSGIQSNIFVLSPCFPRGGCQPVTKYARIPGLLWRWLWLDPCWNFLRCCGSLGCFHPVPSFPLSFTCGKTCFEVWHGSPAFWAPFQFVLPMGIKIFACLTPPWWLHLRGPGLTQAVLRVAWENKGEAGDVGLGCPPPNIWRGRLGAAG